MTQYDNQFYYNNVLNTIFSDYSPINDDNSNNSFSIIANLDGFYQFWPQINELQINTNRQHIFSLIELELNKLLDNNDKQLLFDIICNNNHITDINNNITENEYNNTILCQQFNSLADHLTITFNEHHNNTIINDDYNKCIDTNYRLLCILYQILTPHKINSMINNNNQYKLTQIATLQEIDEDLYLTIIGPILSFCGYYTVYKAKNRIQKGILPGEEHDNWRKNSFVYKKQNNYEIDKNETILDNLSQICIGMTSKSSNTLYQYHLPYYSLWDNTYSGYTFDQNAILNLSETKIVKKLPQIQRNDGCLLVSLYPILNPHWYPLHDENYGLTAGQIFLSGHVFIPTNNTTKVNNQLLNVNNTFFDKNFQPLLIATTHLTSKKTSLGEKCREYQYKLCCFYINCQYLGLLYQYYIFLFHNQQQNESNMSKLQSFSLPLNHPTHRCNYTQNDNNIENTIIQCDGMTTYSKNGIHPESYLSIDISSYVPKELLSNDILDILPYIPGVIFMGDFNAAPCCIGKPTFEPQLYKNITNQPSIWPKYNIDSTNDKSNNNNHNYFDKNVHNLNSSTITLNTAYKYYTSFYNKYIEDNDDKTNILFQNNINSIEPPNQLLQAESPYTTYKIRNNVMVKYPCDYILYSQETLNIIGLGTLPNTMKLPNNGLPNWCFPSDHLPLFALIQFK